MDLAMTADLIATNAVSVFACLVNKVAVVVTQSCRVRQQQLLRCRRGCLLLLPCCCRVWR